MTEQVSLSPMGAFRSLMDLPSNLSMFYSSFPLLKQEIVSLQSTIDEMEETLVKQVDSLKVENDRLRAELEASKKMNSKIQEEVNLVKEGFGGQENKRKNSKTKMLKKMIPKRKNSKNVNTN